MKCFYDNFGPNTVEVTDGDADRAIDQHVALHGGAAGGGKSDALLMAALRDVASPTYAALILRRTLPDLALPGAIMDRAKQWLIPRGDVAWNEQQKRFTFPSGARLQFGFCETPADVYRYQGAEFHFVGVDELTQWPESSYTYLLSRIRRRASDRTPLRARSAGNPGGVGHRWVKRRFVQPGAETRPFIPAKIADNPHLNAEYMAQLELLDETTRRQLRDGLWIEDGVGLVYQFNAERNLVMESPELDGWRTVVAVDLGSSEIKKTTAFAVVQWREDRRIAYVTRAWAESGLTPTTIAERIMALTERHPEARVVMDVGALGAGYAAEMRARFGLDIIPAQKRDKLGFRKLLNGALERGELVIEAATCTDLVAEIEVLEWDKSGLDANPAMADHCTDALLYGWREAQSWLAAFVKHDPPLDEEQAAYQRERERWAERKRQGAWKTW